MSVVISIDGNIGSGKTTIVQRLKDDFKNDNKIIFLDEPVNEWIKITDNNKNIIEKFYENPVKYSFPFQMMALISRFKILNDAINNNPNSIIITERSLFTDKHIFAKMLHDTNKLNNYEFQIYNKWFYEFIKKLPEHKFIYLYTKPDTCINRIKKRNRTGEDKIDVEYLTSCSNYHDIMFSKITQLKLNLDTCDIDSLEYENVINEIKKFIINNRNLKSKKEYDTFVFLIILFVSIYYLFYIF